MRSKPMDTNVRHVPNDLRDLVDAMFLLQSEMETLVN